MSQKLQNNILNNNILNNNILDEICERLSSLEKLYQQFESKLKTFEESNKTKKKQNKTKLKKRSSYNIFMKENLKKVKEENNLSGSEAMKQTAQLWKNLSKIQKQEYEKKAEIENKMINENKQIEIEIEIENKQIENKIKEFENKETLKGKKKYTSKDLKKMNSKEIQSICINLGIEIKENNKIINTKTLKKKIIQSTN